MNIVLWVLQIGLALMNLAGGSYKLFSYEQLAKVPSAAALPRGAWGAIGVFEMLCGVLLVAGPFVTKVPMLTSLVAAALAVEALVVSGIHARYSLALAATNPLVWSFSMAVVSALVAYGRYALRPPA